MRTAISIEVYVHALLTTVILLLYIFFILHDPCNIFDIFVEYLPLGGTEDITNDSVL